MCMLSFSLFNTIQALDSPTAIMDYAIEAHTQKLTKRSRNRRT